MIIIQTNIAVKHFPRTFLIVCKGSTTSQVKKFCYSRITLQSLKNPQLSEQSSSGNQLTQVFKKIIYNSKIKHGRIKEEKLEEKILADAKLTKYKIEGPQVVALKYFYKEFGDEINSAESVQEKPETERVNFPYGRYDSISINAVPHDQKIQDACENISLSQENELHFQDIKDRVCKPPKKWMKDYNKYVEVSVKQHEHEEGNEKDDENVPDIDYYGSADPSVPPSSVPCGGCGAHLHCQDSAVPGYLPKELFVELKEDQLQAVVCQRCHFLREYETALSVTVDPQMYPQLLSKIKDKPALVILVVDMTDFPCSIWPGILDIIGPKRPLVVVGNKIDLVQDWSKEWLDRAKEALVAQLPPKANLLHVSLVSAKTGYGIEQLISSLYNLWQYRGDVYLVGCTNVGKSTLFNTLLQSDYCKTKAVDLVQRATTAPWPGTTLNLLKFPIMRPEAWRMAMRSHRLKTQHEDLRVIQKGHVEVTPQMITGINRTFESGKTDKYSDDYWEDPFAMPRLSTLRRLKPPGSGLDPNDPVFANSKWLFDTPGVITPDQIIDLLTAEELLLTLPQRPMVPRTLQVWRGQSLLLGGLGRIDYVSGSTNIKMTVLAAHTLPTTICLRSDADEIYHHYLGSTALAVPCGSARRLDKWPGLTAAPTFVLRGTGWKESCADVILSSAGWVAITVEKDAMCQLQAWTPSARGIHVRFPPLLPRAIAVKGCKMHRSPSYALFNRTIKGMR